MWALNPLSTSPTKCLNTLKPFVGNLSLNSLSVFDNFEGLALEGLKDAGCLFEFLRYLLNHTSFGHGTWPTNRYSHALIYYGYAYLHDVEDWAINLGPFIFTHLRQLIKNQLL